MRAILLRYHGVEVGEYSYGPILNPGILPPGTKVGRYCSVGPELLVFRRNHPIDRPALHPFFYRASLGYVANDTIQAKEDNPLRIENDVWIGGRVTILPGCKSIGNGAVIGAGAVVVADVPAYALVAGVPAKVIKMRFDDPTIGFLEASRWWQLPIERLFSHSELFMKPASESSRLLMNELENDVR